MKNNLFKYATSELSQDAFISWLMSYAMPDAKADAGLRKCAIAFIKEFVPKLANTPDDSIAVTELKLQYKKIDVLLTINDKYKVIIEDKTNTSEHDDQLGRYKKILVKEDNIPADDLFCVYYKTGFDSDLSSVINAGYAIFDRPKILAILNANSKGITNDIFLDYLDYYNNFDKEALQYKELPVNKWSWNMVLAFYNSLKKETNIDRSLLDGEFDFEYVQNPYGGFYALWLFPKKQLKFGEETLFRPYIQIETRSCDIVGQDKGDINICFRLYIDTHSTSVISASLKNAIVHNNTTEWKYDLEQFGLKKPSRLGNGKSMTIGRYWETSSKGDICQTITYPLIIEALEKSIEQFAALYEHIEKKVAK